VNADDIRVKLAAVFQEVLGSAVSLRDDLKPGDLEGWDSLAHVSIIGAVEKEFKIKFKGADIAKAVSVGDLLTQIRAKVVDGAQHRGAPN
jgi:acyl carrier protein